MQRVNFQYMKIIFKDKQLKCENIESYSYTHDKLLLSGGVDMKRYIQSKKLIFIHNNGDITNLFFDLPISLIDTFMSSEVEFSLMMSFSNSLLSEYENDSLLLKNLYNQKTFILLYNLAELIRNQIKDISVIINSDCHGDLVMFLLPYVISNSIYDINLKYESDKIRIAYLTNHTRTIHVNAGDYFADTNYLRNAKPEFKHEVEVNICYPCNTVIQTFLFSILSDSLSYRINAYFIMGNHDKHFFLRKPSIKASYQTRVNNIKSLNEGIEYFNRMSEIKGLDIRIHSTDISIFQIPRYPNFQYINNDSLIDNMSVKIFLRIGEQFIFVKHALFKINMTDLEKSISSLGIIHRDIIDENKDVFVYKFDQKQIIYDEIYEKPINIYKDKTEKVLNIKNEEMSLLREISEFNKSCKERFLDFEMKYIPLIILGHNRHYEFLKFYKQLLTNNKNDINFNLIDNAGQTRRLEVLYAKEVLNGLNDISTIFCNSYCSDMLNNSTVSEYIKSLKTKIINNLPYFNRLKGGSNNFNQLIIIFILIIIIIICLHFIRGYRNTEINTISIQKPD